MSCFNCGYLRKEKRDYGNGRLEEVYYCNDHDYTVDPDEMPCRYYD